MRATLRIFLVCALTALAPRASAQALDPPDGEEPGSKQAPGSKRPPEGQPSPAPTRATIARFPPDVIGVLAGEKKKATELRFVGRSGQIYVPAGNMWKRTGVGGIATDVVGAVTTPSGIYAIPDRAPMFKKQAGVWQATPLANRGYTAFQPHGSMIMAALGRHVYRLDRGKWVRYATAARRVTALYPAAKNRVYMATTRGRLRRSNGSAAVVIKNPMATSDSVRKMLGVPGGDLFGVSQEGTIFAIGASSATEVKPAGSLAGLTIHTLGYGPKRAIYGAGVVQMTDTSRSVLVELSGTSVREVRPLPQLSPKDRFTVIHTARDGRLVVATFSGQVLLSKPDGSWETRWVSGEAPVTAAGAPTAASPARSR